MNVLVEFGGTLTVALKFPVPSVTAVATGGPEQSPLAYIVTVEFGSDVPCNMGEVLFEGEAGFVPVKIGTLGGVLSKIKFEGDDPLPEEVVTVISPVVAPAGTSVVI